MKKSKSLYEMLRWEKPESELWSYSHGLEIANRNLHDFVAIKKYGKRAARIISARFFRGDGRTVEGDAKRMVNQISKLKRPTKATFVQAKCLYIFDLSETVARGRLVFIPFRGI